MKGQRGQSLVEVVFAVLVMSLTLTGVVVLVSSSLSRINKGFDRKKAAELGRNVVENLVSQRRDDPLAFWQLDGIHEDTLPGFEGYVYSVGYTVVTNVAGCTLAGRECAQAYVTVSLVGDSSPDERVTLTRFFSKNNN